MRCRWCNSEVNENAKFCTNCGGSLNNEVNQTNTTNMQTIQEPIVNMNNNIQQQNNSSANNEQKANVGLVILSILIPIAGLIIFLVKKDDDKKTAKASGIAALISFGVSLIISIITIICIITFTTRTINNGINNIINDAEEIIEDQLDDETLNDVEDYFNDIQDSIEDQINTNTNSEWKNYQVSINNKTIKLPCSYNELSSATSFTMKSSYANSYLESGYYALVNLYKNDNLALYIEVLNDTGTDQLYTDCKVTRISQTKYQVSVGADEVIFPGGLKVGQSITKDEIINLLGTPNDIDNYTSDGYVKDTYSYVEDSTYTTTNNYKISVVNGVIDEISLDNRNYN